jgi:flagellar hook-associated protein 3 FlgL
MTIGFSYSGALSQGSVRTRQTASMLTSLKTTAEDLQRQLSTGKIADTYSAQGAGRFRSLDLRAKLAGYDGFSATIQDAELRLKLMDLSITRLQKSASDTRSDLLSAGSTFDVKGKTTAQTGAEQRLSEAVDLLNQNIDGRYLFAGRASDTKPVLPASVLLDGTGLQAGVKTLIAERKLADLGTGSGRLATSLAGTTLSVSATGGAFGFGVSNITTGITGATVTPPAGTPPTMSVDLPTQPADGNTVTVSLTLPDGSTTNLTLTARSGGSSATSGANDFQIGATPALTAANLKTALDGAITKAASTVLSSASAMTAAKSFFTTDGSPPMRVTGPNFATATTLTAGTPANTVIWYQGDSTTNPRATAPVRADEGTPVGIGAQANEQPFAETIAAFAALASETFPASDTTRTERYNALTSAVRSALNPAPGTAKSIVDVQKEFGAAAVQINDAKKRNKDASAALTGFLSEIENTKSEETVAALLAVQNRLQASYETTSMISKMSLVNYLP